MDWDWKGLMVACSCRLAQVGIASNQRELGGVSGLKWRSRCSMRSIRSNHRDAAGMDHVPVLLEEVLDCFSDVHMQVMLDVVVLEVLHWVCEMHQKLEVADLWKCAFNRCMWMLQ